MRYRERTMGAFYGTIRVGDAKGERFEDVRALAGTGVPQANALGRSR